MKKKKYNFKIIFFFSSDTLEIYFFGENKSRPKIEI